jgi:hypothetical protein
VRVTGVSPLRELPPILFGPTCEIVVFFIKEYGSRPNVDMHFA